MANRPIFLPQRSKTSFVLEANVEFRWFPGMSVSQKQKSVGSLHEAARERFSVSNILEISTKSPDPLGVRLSAFNLTRPLSGNQVTVEVAYQAGKRFEMGGPFLDILGRSSCDAKTDPRLKESGRLVGFSLPGEPWPLEPITAFYNWLYLSALLANPDLAERLPEFEAFTDIEFNPRTSINCQARSAALFVSLSRECLLKKAMSDKATYLEVLGECSSSKHNANRVELPRTLKGET